MSFMFETLAVYSGNHRSYFVVRHSCQGIVNDQQNSLHLCSTILEMNALIGSSQSK